jgi:hypothetical protein
MIAYRRFSVHPALTYPPGAGDEPATLLRLRRMLLAIFTLGTVGTGTELLLIGHFEDQPQFIPLSLIGAALAATAWLALRPGQAALRTFQVLMMGFVLGGAVGVGLHYQGNEEFELEMYPEMAGVELVKETLTGALPVLAPGTMSVLGLVGLAVTYRHPRTTRTSSEA